MPNDQLLYRNVQLLQGGLVFKAHRLLYHSTLGLRVMKKKDAGTSSGGPDFWFQNLATKITAQM